MLRKGGYVYIMTNKNHTTLYIGVSSKLKQRVWDHKENKYPRSFTSRYSIHKLVYYEKFSSITEAIEREKQLKGKSRAKKKALISAFNPEWADMFEYL